MTYNEAASLRDSIKEKLIGLNITHSNSHHIIKDVIISNYQNVANVYSNMWNNKISNDLALRSFQIENTEFDVFLISHQWNWGSGDLFYDSYKNYLKRTTT